MPQIIRNRVDNSNLQNGRFYRTSGSSDRYCSIYYSKKTMDDILHYPPRSGEPMEIKRNLVTGSINGQWGNRVFINWLPDRYWNSNISYLQGHLSDSRRPTDSALVTTLLMRANPESIKSNFPLFLFELRELPSMLKQIGDVLRRRSPPSLGTPGQYWLGYNFGWAPLVDDLGAMLTCLDSVEKRARQLVQIQRKGGKTIRRDLFKGYVPRTYRGSYTAQSLGAILYSDEYWEYTKRSISGYCRYVPKGPPVSDRALFKRAWNTYHGLKLRPSQLWDAFPWSWFSDYFLNIGDYVAATQGGCDYRLTEYALMEDATTSLIGYIYNDIGSAKLYRNIYTSRRRWKPPISVDTKFDTPFLTKYQTSILGSLITARLFR